MTQPALQTLPQLELVPFDPAHRINLEMQLSDARVTDWLPFSHPFDVAELDMLLARVAQPAGRPPHLWMAEDMRAPQLGFVGAMGLQMTGSPLIAQVFYWVVPEHQSKGYGTEMLEIISDLVLNGWGCTRLQAMVAPDNAPSIRVLEKAGFQREGLLRRFFGSSFADETALMDVYMYAKLKD